MIDKASNPNKTMLEKFLSFKNFLKKSCMNKTARKLARPFLINQLYHIQLFFP